MKSKILSLMFVLGVVAFCNDAKTQGIPSDCGKIIDDLAKIPPNTSQAAQVAFACVKNIAGSVAQPLCSAGKSYQACSALCDDTYGAHDVGCCLDAFATAKAPLPSTVTSVLDDVCGAFGKTVSDVSWCSVIPATPVDVPGAGSMPTNTAVADYIGYICCPYCKIQNNCNVSGCLATPTPKQTCDAYPPLNMSKCTSSLKHQKKK